MKWKKKLEQRFWEKVDKRGPNECWPWIGAASQQKGGQMRGPQMRGLMWDGTRVVPAPRLSLILTGINLNGLCALHKCNNSICVNPSHLYAGTLSQNQQDSIAAGTFVHHPAPRGEKNYRAKLKERDIPEIRRMHLGGLSKQAISDRYGVTRAAIRKIITGKTWSHV